MAVCVLAYCFAMYVKLIFSCCHLYSTTPQENAVIQQFRLRSEASIVGFYLSTLESPKLAREPRDLATPTNLNGCVIVTSDAVYYCKQK